MSLGSLSAHDLPLTSRPGSVPALREILVPTDLSAAADQALAHARMIGQRFNSHLTLYHVVEAPQRDYASWAEDDNAVWTDTRREAFRELSCRAGTARVRNEVVVELAASAQRAVIASVRSRRPDLVVMATHGRSGLPHLLLGSVTESVLQHGHRPLLCVRGATKGTPLPYRRLLVPTDLSPESRRAFPLAGLLARGLGAEIVVLHVVALSTLPNLSGLSLAREAHAPSEEAVRRFLARDLDGVPLTVRIERGTAWDRIVHCAGEESADLVVMATRGLDSVADRVLGSHTQRVVRQAPCPVLVA